MGRKKNFNVLLGSFDQPNYKKLVKLFLDHFQAGEHVILRWFWNKIGSSFVLQSFLDALKTKEAIVLAKAFLRELPIQQVS